MRINGFQGNGKFYKGNFHCHTTISDGKLSPEETVRAYKAKGYDFMALTDHNIYNALTQIGQESMLIIPGAEMHCLFEKKIGSDVFKATHHMVCLDPGKNQPGKPFAQGEKFTNFVAEDGRQGLRIMQAFIENRRCVAIYCHPDWSRVELEDIQTLDGFAAMEIFNTESHFCGDVGGTTTYWDHMLRRNRHIFACASDDSHNLYTMGRGWIQVKSEELTHEAIMENFLKGNFYASTGPEIHDFYVEDGYIHVECSPCRKIHVVQAFFPGKTAFEGDDKLITSATVPFTSDKPKYIRIVCEDAEGHRAWSNPIYL